MIPVTIKLPYRKFLFFGTIRQKEIHINVPQSWNELTPAQIFAYVVLVYSKMDLIFSRETNPKTKQQYLRVQNADEFNKARVGLMFYLLGVKQHVFNRIHSFELSSLISEFNLLDFFFKEITLTRNPVPKYRILHGPADAFSNLVAAEFSFADTYYMRYKKKKESKYLDLLIAVLYRPADKKYNPKSPDSRNDIRQKFNSHLVDDRIKIVEKFPLRIKLAILLYYEGCRADLEKKYDYVFSGSTSGKVNRYGWAKVLLQMSGQKFGTDEQTEAVPIHKFLLDINISMEDQEEFERKNKSKK